ncbi:capsular biosynthesis protein [Clostridium carboxidivorans P7]|uniref:Lipopolysaccharide biosynthesis protein n=1 Tax=Clostridium carboxidivorans P7 TaxID=536227 RepID=C6PXX4_9CLOT|nr:Wzz/FepE/Etk N-terminal domain-containing protein [Clostridium carboxidivorans]AKN34184.1 capsular biosynthesis protein [Clostridium carboxidivorans P7]EET85912.1 lipopolysaccharide biosynthesis protein [Clostridium carboxidivorans P7]
MEEEISLDLYEFLHIIKKRIKLILLITILSTVVSGVLSYYVIKPTYEAKATIVIGKVNVGSNDNSRYQYDDIMMFQNLAKTYAEIAKSTSVAESASARLKNVSVNDILNNITVSPMANTQLIEFKAKNSSPQEAYLMIIAVYNSFIQEAKRIYPGQNIQVMDKVKMPEQPVKPKKLLNITIAFFMGLIVSIGIAFLLEYIDNTLKTEQDVNKYLNLPVIGTIPKDTEKY